ncbi:MAG TPA: hypothetical protein VHH88_14065, partial [Verrucomicrobiae bacterium]|nr:hypothetical protein [Verrucomicrobiae bacterium]
GTGSEAIIKQHARALANQNNPAQTTPPPARPTAPAPRPAAPRSSAGQIAFQTDLAVLKPGTEATATQKHKMVADILSMAQGTKPTEASVSNLANDLAATVAAADEPLSAATRARLAQELDAVLNPSKYPSANIAGIFADIQAIFQQNGGDRHNAAKISDDVKALQAH